MRRPLACVLVACCLCFSLSSVAAAQQQPAAPATDDSVALAKKLSNPISDLVSVPFQFNWAQNIGPFELTQFILNIQPVIPFTLNKDWNMIVRVIAPFVGQPALFVNGEPAFGMGDTTNSFFFSPTTTGSFTIGAGPVVVLPSTQVPTIGSGKWSAGPTVVALRQEGKWTYGALWNQVWSFSGDSRRADINQMFLQPFLAYQANKTITLTVQSETTANWEATDGGRWTVPINFLIAKLSTFGVFPASYQLGYGVFAVHPDSGPTWKIRAVIVILLPRKKA